MSKLAVDTFPPQLLSWAETIYFGMFNILGATLILIALDGGCGEPCGSWAVWRVRIT